MKASKLKLMTLAMATATLIGVTLDAQAHTRFRVPVIDENAANHGSNYNDVVVAHGCQNTTDGASTIDTLGTVVVFPEKDAPIIKTRVAGSTGEYEIHDGVLTDFVANWGSPVTVIQDAGLFEFQEYIRDPLGNKIGFWSGGGRVLKAGFRGLLPIATAGVVINPESCAKSVTFVAAIADICEITDPSGFSNGTLQLWTEAVGSVFDGEGLHGFNSPATLTVNRSIAALPESCGDGLDVKVVPSAEQLNRDFNIKFQGQQIWPAQ